MPSAMRSRHEGHRQITEMAAFSRALPCWPMASAGSEITSGLLE